MSQVRTLRGWAKEEILEGGKGRDLLSRTAYLQTCRDLLKETGPALSAAGTRHRERVSSLYWETSTIAGGKTTTCRHPFEDKRAIDGKPDGSKTSVHWSEGRE